MDVTDRPSIRCLVGFVSEGGEYLAFGRTDKDALDAIPPNSAWPKVMSLEEGERLRRCGFWVLVDPASQHDLAMWENAQRAIQQEQTRHRKWFDREDDDAA